MRMPSGRASLFLFACLALSCKKEEPPSGTAGTAGSGTTAGAAGSDAGAAAAARPSGPAGVDMEKKTVKIGALNDESGPGAAIGKKYAIGKRLLVKAVNAGDVKALPEGWKVELVEKDHAYNPQQSVQHYNAIKDDVLYIAHSFGTPNTMPLIPMLERDGMVAFPASLSSELAKHKETPPLGPSYKIEAMRAMDFAVENGGGADKVKAAIVYQQDDYGKDGLAGWTAAAAHHKVEVVEQQAVAPGQKDYAAVVTALKNKGATHVLLTTLPSGTGPLLGTAAQLGYKPVWIGNTPAWIDRFFSAEVIPPPVLANFHWVTGITYWGEDVPGMKEFVALWDKDGKEFGDPDFYILASYFQGLVGLEALKRAIEGGKPVTRSAYLAGLTAIESYDGNGMFQPVRLNKIPYETAARTRILKPKLADKTWEVVAPYAYPKAPTGP
jgi:ABC-type branched-subunit amino acid transport system substrate-binding protein